MIGGRFRTKKIEPLLPHGMNSLFTTGSDGRARLKETTKIEDTLKERGSRYGEFDTHAQYAERINNVFESSPNWQIMKPDSKEALRIIANKIGRILNGDPEYDDNWHDIAGYATLVKNRIDRDASST